MGDQPDFLFTGTGRTVCALDRYTGRPVWRVKVGGVLGSSISMVLPRGREVYIGRGSYVYCLDVATGQVLWERGVGNGMWVVMATAGDASETMQQQAHVATAMRQAAQASAGAAAGGAAGAGA